MRTKITREFYLPKNGRKLKLPKGLTEKDCEVWFYNTNDKLCAVAFKGKSEKPYFRYSFKNAEHRDEYTLKFYLEIYNNIQSKKKVIEDKKHMINFLKVDDILYCSWGYDQTNINYYKIVSVKGMFVELVEIGQKISEITGWASKNVLPDKNRKIGNVIRKKFLGGIYPIKINQVQWLKLWDGKAHEATSYA